MSSARAGSTPAFGTKENQGVTLFTRNPFFFYPGNDSPAGQTAKTGPPSTGQVVPLGTPESLHPPAGMRIFQQEFRRFIR